MPADEFRAELLASLTDFYEKILKKVGAGGGAAKKPLPRKFAPKIAPVPAHDDANDGAAAEEEQPEPAPAPPPAAEAAGARESSAPPTPPPAKGAKGKAKGQNK